MNNMSGQNKNRYNSVKAKIENGDYISDEDLEFYTTYIEKTNQEKNSNKQIKSDSPFSFRPKEETIEKMNFINNTLNLQGNKSLIVQQSIENFYLLLKNKQFEAEDQKISNNYLQTILNENSKQLMINQYLLSVIIDFLNVSPDKIKISSHLDLKANPFENNSIEILKLLNYQVDQDYKSLMVKKNSRKYKNKRG
ncbi:hypothetical protein P7D73_18230 [Enterococcus raffinosus]|uniref:hypothetical protein n=1 Tax=Enterococcus raffinosus TaxID=71452 RepID=UPI002892585F|nr:hypothetical protein [Enterococcus raffinosus]MDT2525145.1 hypothetical protein [Enterococcus raffinosus]MDT2592500.1 hypothetical protein [Enterococcus raffinosus]